MRTTPFFIVAVVVAVLALAADREASAQTSKTKSKPVNVSALEVQVQKAEEAFIREMFNLSRSYEEAGEIERAKTLLQAVRRLNDKLPGVEQKLEQLDEKLLDSNQVEFEVDTARSWSGPVAQVAKGKPFRVQVQGTYRLMSNLTLGPDGIGETKSPEDMASGIPFGALTGTIVSQGQGSAKKPNIKTGKPFAIGAQREVTPEEDGLLFLRVNVPPGFDGNGKLKVSLSGHLRGL